MSGMTDGKAQAEQRAVPSLRWLQDNHAAWVKDSSDTPYLVWLHNAMLALPAPAAVAGDAVRALVERWRPHGRVPLCELEAALSSTAALTTQHKEHRA